MRSTIYMLAIVMGFVSLSSQSSAEMIYGIAELGSQNLVRYDSTSPGSIISSIAISGLQANESIKGIDFRPATNQLYALGSSSRLYQVNTNTGQVFAVGTPFTPTLNGTSFGFDFNPAIDRIRVVAETNTNTVLNPNDGTGTGVTNLFYGAGDPNFGVDPNVVDSAYTNSFSGPPNPQTPARTTQLYGIDTGLDILVTQANSAGTLGTVGGLGLDVVSVGGFDISPIGNQIAYAALLPANATNSRLYTINLGTGLATQVGEIDGGLFISSLAVAPDRIVQPDIPEPTSMVLVLTGLVGVISLRQRRA
ncbi:DUF4394 domain-containing protein [Bythopirellula goksoeyrii]|uniref:DUF4394 domain-containing protein n=1 Tax=Bythopirellula goksoeyrii TaxID=1400387 RepID=A0A5B9Q581_9BACT|nr:DUF4394 domain-containing protein [Bythopirellula goksoeyrii]QEG32829.1 hypothetical protein Pr1d_00890 [Bythopirellula goksoeyrii]